jgi:hypothetical protein
MGSREQFEIVCPNNHNQMVNFSPEEFESALRSGKPLFHCNTCEADWSPSAGEIATMRKQLGLAH